MGNLKPGTPARKNHAVSAVDALEANSYHSMKSANVLEALGTGKGGLSEHEAAKRLEKFGKNAIKTSRQSSALELFISQFANPMLILLAIAGAIAYFFERSASNPVPLDTVGIAAAIIISGAFGFFQEYKAARELEALKRLATPTARVVRDGVEKIVMAQNLVPGDIIVLEEGTRVPSDARLLEAISLCVDESMLTGESMPSEKAESPCQKSEPLAQRSSMVYFGTTVVSGRGIAIAVATGMETEFGSIAQTLGQTPEQQTPLQKHMEELGKKIGIYSFFIVAIYFAIGVMAGNNAQLMFISAVTLAVVSIPEGLPTILTITLAIGMQRMAAQHALVRHLPAVESLGSTTVICTDKTGTLTENKMSVTEVFTLSQQFVFESGKFTASKNAGAKAQAALRRALEAGALCNNANIALSAGNELVQTGDPTESAILVAAAKYGIDVESMRLSREFVSEFPFDSKRKTMAVVRRENGRLVSFVKGAPEQILPMCAFALTEKGIEKLGEKQRAAIAKANSLAAAKAMRLISVAFKPLNTSAGNVSFDMAHSGLIFAGTIAMVDPPRFEVPEALAKCASAGIRVVVITGDNLLTARAISRQIGLVTKDSQCINAFEIDALSEQQLCEKVKSIAVYARATPQHKFRIVSALSNNGEVVAVTGDGVNDAPAIKKADIGISMGSGTDVSKESADIILTDDNFATIVNAISYGRNLFDNIKSFIRFQFSTNVSAILTMLAAPLIGLSLPLLPLQALWVNIIMDGPPALALGLEGASPGSMSRPPVDPKKPFISAQLLAHVGLSCLIMAAGTLAIFFIYSNSADSLAREQAQTMAFTVFVFFQLFNALNCKSAKQSLLENLFSNKLLVAALGACFALQVAIIYAAPLEQVFGTVPLGAFELGACIMVSFVIILASEAVKRVVPSLTNY